MGLRPAVLLMRMRRRRPTICLALLMLTGRHHSDLRVALVQAWPSLSQMWSNSQCWAAFRGMRSADLPEGYLFLPYAAAPAGLGTGRRYAKRPMQNSASGAHSLQSVERKEESPKRERNRRNPCCEKQREALRGSLGSTTAARASLHPSHKLPLPRSKGVESPAPCACPARRWAIPAL